MFGAVEAVLAQLLDALRCASRDVLDRLDVVREATRGQARTLAYQFGSPPEVGARNLAPRSMIQLPYIWEGDVQQQTKLDFLADAGRYVSSGFYANLGETPVQVVLVGIDGQVSAAHTLPPGATVQVSSFLAGVVVLPGDEGEGRVQVYVS